MARRVPHHEALNKFIANACIGTCASIYVAWNYSHGGIVYDVMRDGTRTLQKAKLLPSHWNIPEPQRVRDTLLDKTVHRTGTQTIDPESALLSNFSHMSFTHLAFNTMAFHSFSRALTWLPTRHFVGILTGSAVAATGAFAYDHWNEQSAGLGMSGIVSGAAMTATCLFPTATGQVFFFSAPLWALTGGFFLLDAYLARSDFKTGIGHSAHLGGAFWGAFYYGFFLRRYGGVFGPRVR